MNFNPEYHHRKSIRLKEYDYRYSNWYHITICTKNKINWFGKISKSKMILSDIGKKVKECWEMIPMHFNFCKLDYYIVMPNHFHGNLIINDHKVVESSRSVLRKESVRHLNASKRKIYFSKISPKKGSLGIIVRTFKGAVKKYCNQSGLKNFEWQRNYYEHIIRNETDLFYIRKYMDQNPLKWELDEYYKK